MILVFFKLNKKIVFNWICQSYLNMYFWKISSWSYYQTSFFKVVEFGVLCRPAYNLFQIKLKLYYLNCLLKVVAFHKWKIGSINKNNLYTAYFLRIIKLNLRGIFYKTTNIKQLKLSVSRKQKRKIVKLGLE